MTMGEECMAFKEWLQGKEPPPLVTWLYDRGVKHKQDASAVFLPPEKGGVEVEDSHSWFRTRRLLPCRGLWKQGSMPQIFKLMHASFPELVHLHIMKFGFAHLHICTIRWDYVFNGILTSQEKIELSWGLETEPCASSLEKLLVPRKQHSEPGSSTLWISQEILAKIFAQWVWSLVHLTQNYFFGCTFLGKIGNSHRKPDAFVI